MRPYLLVALFCLVTAIGCERAPRAPALVTTAEFRDNREGLRFGVPDGWTMTSRAALPSRLEDDVILAQYKLSTPEQGSLVEVVVFDEETPSDLQKYHAGPSHGVREWPSQTEPEEVEINGAKADRYVYQAPTQGKEMTKEVVVFRRGRRVYSFVGLFFSHDDKAREQVRRAVDSIMWR